MHKILISGISLGLVLTALAPPAKARFKPGDTVVKTYQCRRCPPPPRCRPRCGPRRTPIRNALKIAGRAVARTAVGVSILAQRAAQNGVRVNTPGVNVQVGGGAGVRVNTPGTYVGVGGGQGVRVNTGGGYPRPIPYGQTPYAKPPTYGHNPYQQSPAYGQTPIYQQNPRNNLYGMNTMPVPGYGGLQGGGATRVNVGGGQGVRVRAGGTLVQVGGGQGVRVVTR